MELKYLQFQWDHVRSGLVWIVDQLTDEDLDFVPFPGAWSVRQMLLHIAQEELGELCYGIMQKIDGFPEAYAEEDYPTRASIQALLKSVHAQTLAYLATLDDAALKQDLVTPWGASGRRIEWLGHILEHEIHHRGELSLILGLLGRKGLDA